MKLRNDNTGDVVEIPPPGIYGQSTVLFNGRVVETVLYSDDDGGSVTTEDGRVFHGEEWAHYIANQLRHSAWDCPTQPEESPDGK